MPATVGALQVVLSADATGMARALTSSGATITAFEQGAARSFRRVDAGFSALNKSVSLNRLQLLELGHSARATFDILAAGGSPMRALALEGAQVVQALAMGEGGLGGAITGIGRAVGGLLTPTNLAIAAVAALGVGAVTWLASERGKTVDATKALEEHKKWLDQVLAGYDEAKKSVDGYLRDADKLPGAAVASNVAADQTKQLALYASALAMVKSQQAGLSQDIAGLVQVDGSPEIIAAFKSINDAVTKTGLGVQTTKAQFDGLVTALTLLKNSATDDSVAYVAEQMLAVVQNAEKARSAIQSDVNALNSLPDSVSVKINVEMKGFTAARKSLLGLMPDMRDQWTKARDDAKAAYGQEVGAATDDILRQAAAQDYAKVLAGIDAAEKAALAKKTGGRTAKVDPAASVTASLSRQLAALTLTDREQQISNNLAAVHVTATSREGQAIAALTGKLFDQKSALEAANQASQFFGQTIESAFEAMITGGASATNALKGVRDAIANAVLQAELLGSGPLASLLGTAPGKSGGLGGLFGSIASAIFKPSAPTMTPLQWAGFDGGGYTGDGGRLTPAGIVHKGEYVFNAAATARIGRGRLDALQGYATGGYVGGEPISANGNTRSIEIINNGPPAQVESATTRKGAGGVDIDTIVIGSVNKGIASGKLDATMKATYGLNRQGR